MLYLTSLKTSLRNSEFQRLNVSVKNKHQATTTLKLHPPLHWCLECDDCHVPVWAVHFFDLCLCLIELQPYIQWCLPKNPRIGLCRKEEFSMLLFWYKCSSHQLYTFDIPVLISSVHVSASCERGARFYLVVVQLLVWKPEKKADIL